MRSPAYWHKKFNYGREPVLTPHKKIWRHTVAAAAGGLLIKFVAKIESCIRRRSSRRKRIIPSGRRQHRRFSLSLSLRCGGSRAEDYDHESCSCTGGRGSIRLYKRVHGHPTAVSHFYHAVFGAVVCPRRHSLAHGRRSPSRTLCAR